MLLAVGKWIAAGYLVQAVLWDIRKRVVPVWLIRLVLLCAVVLRSVDTVMGISDVGDIPSKLTGLLGAALPGLLLLVIGYLTREAVGYADGWSVLLLGLLMGSQAAVCIMMTAFLFSAMYALWLIIGRRADKDMRFPFLPHISAGFIVWLMVL